jgi:hypothetical protein
VTEVLNRRLNKDDLTAKMKTDRAGTEVGEDHPRRVRQFSVYESGLTATPSSSARSTRRVSANQLRLIAQPKDPSGQRTGRRAERPGGPGPVRPDQAREAGYATVTCDGAGHAPDSRSVPSLHARPRPRARDQSRTRTRYRTGCSHLCAVDHTRSILNLASRNPDRSIHLSERRCGAGLK